MENVKLAWNISTEIANLKLEGAFDSDYFRLALTKFTQSIYTPYTPAVTFDVQSSVSIGSVQMTLDKEFTNTFGSCAGFHVALHESLLDLDHWVTGTRFNSFVGLRVKPLVKAAALGHSKGVVLYQQIADCKFKTFLTKLHEVLRKEDSSLNIRVALHHALETRENDAKGGMSATAYYFSLVGQNAQVEAAFAALFLDRADIRFHIARSVYERWYYIEQGDMSRCNLDHIFPSSCVSKPIETPVKTKEVEKETQEVTKEVEKETQEVTKEVAKDTKDSFMKELTVLYEAATAKTFIEKQVADTLEDSKAILRKCASGGFNCATLHWSAHDAHSVAAVIFCVGGNFHLFTVPASLKGNPTLLYEAFDKVIPFTEGTKRLDVVKCSPFSTKGPCAFIIRGRAQGFKGAQAASPLLTRRHWHKPSYDHCFAPPLQSYNFCSL